MRRRDLLGSEAAAGKISKCMEVRNVVIVGGLTPLFWPGSSISPHAFMLVDGRSVVVHDMCPRARTLTRRGH